MSGEKSRRRLTIHGVVQGVGFRPYVYDLALRHDLGGWVSNTADGVELEVEGLASAVDAFVRELPQSTPPLAFIVDLLVAELPPRGEGTDMRIVASRGSKRRSALLPPDVTVCDACLGELRDPADRRYRYPFVNCTHCGPRYTIINDIPYDRDKTTMARFPMCEACQREYDDPLDRRFHAQPNACWTCGPRCWLCAPDGERMVCEEPIREAAQRLRGGKIVAIKGLGGFHLTVDATNADAVARLRERKHREGKPLAVMCRSLAEASQVVVIDESARAWLSSRHRPIVLLPRRDDTPIAADVAPGNPDIGVMLPYTPLHALLLDDSPPWVVMTSGNASEEPIAIDNQEALTRLGGIADCFLLHDRDILVRNDDSVIRPIGGVPRFVRRSRGYVPLPVQLEREEPCVLAVGGELKNTICLTRGRMAFMSQHIGDQANEEALASFTETVERMQRILDVRPQWVAADAHPDYATTRWADAQEVPVVLVQHHHAHIASCLAENRHEGPAIGLALDGTGLGSDGAIWGGEVLIADLAGFRRAGHLGTVRQPGGDMAAREPWRMAVSHLVHAFGGDWQAALPPGLGAIPAERLHAIARVVETGFNAPWTSSTGRLFDAMAALCGMHATVRFEAEAAMALEMAAWRGVLDEERWHVEIAEDADGWVIDPAELVRPAVHALRRGATREQVAIRFHRSLVESLAMLCERLKEQTGLATVALSGGTFQNRLLTELLEARLSASGMRVLTHHQVPSNDGGLALGQAIVAARTAQTRA